MIEATILEIKGGYSVEIVVNGANKERFTFATYKEAYAFKIGFDNAKRNISLALQN